MLYLFHHSSCVLFRFHLNVWVFSFIFLLSSAGFIWIITRIQTSLVHTLCDDHQHVDASTYQYSIALAPHLHLLPQPKLQRTWVPHLVTQQYQKNQALPASVLLTADMTWFLQGPSSGPLFMYSGTVPDGPERSSLSGPLPLRAHVTPLLINLHWIPMAAQIKFKSLMHAFRVTSGFAPIYLNSIIHAYAPSCTLCSVCRSLCTAKSLSWPFLLEVPWQWIKLSNNMSSVFKNLLKSLTPPLTPKHV